MPRAAPRCAGLAGRTSRFGPQVSRAYLEMLDERMKAVKEALYDGFGVAPSRVVQSSYEPIQYDETGAFCGMRPTLGVDVHPKLRISRERIQEASTFQGELLTKLECMSDVTRRRDCQSAQGPARLPTTSVRINVRGYSLRPSSRLIARRMCVPGNSSPRLKRARQSRSRRIVVR